MPLPPTPCRPFVCHSERSEEPPHYASALVVASLVCHSRRDSASLARRQPFVCHSRRTPTFALRLHCEPAFALRNGKTTTLAPAHTQKAPTARNIPAWAEGPGNASQTIRGLEARHITLNIVLLIVATTVFRPCATARANPQIFSVAAARQNAAQLGAKQISVKGHVWWGKEGSMIYDSYYKAILRLHYSDAFNSKYPGLAMLRALKSRKSNVATVTGHLRTESDGQLNLIADDIQFSENPIPSTAPKLATDH